MADFRVLITGSRNWLSAHTIDVTLDELLAQHGTLTVVHGACREGADKMAHNWALNARHASSFAAVTAEAHPANWRPGGKFDKSAGFRRNAEMVALGADVCLAFVAACARPNCPKLEPHGSHGASHCAQLAEANGIEVRRITGG